MVWFEDEANAFSEIVLFSSPFLEKGNSQGNVRPREKSNITQLNFPLSGETFCRLHSVGFTGSRETKKSSSKMLLQWELNPRPLASMPCMLPSEVIHICWKSQTFRSLYNHALLIPKNSLSQGINRA